MYKLGGFSLIFNTILPHYFLFSRPRGSAFQYYIKRELELVLIRLVALDILGNPFDRPVQTLVEPHLRRPP